MAEGRYERVGAEFSSFPFERFFAVTLQISKPDPLEISYEVGILQSRLAGL